MRAVHSRLLALALVCGSVPLAALTAAPIQEWAFGSLERLKVSNGARAELVTYRGRRAVHLIVSPDRDTPKYEAYADLEPGVWTSLKIVVSDRRGELYVNGAAQPCLVVTDLKLGDTRGGVALWAHAGTDAYFSRVIIRPN